MYQNILLTDSYFSPYGNNVAYTSGNVGIGTTNPTQTLHVEGTTYSNAVVEYAPHITFNGSTRNRNLFLNWLTSSTSVRAGNWWARSATPRYSTITGAPGSLAYYGGVLVPDGRVVFVPYNSATIGIFDPSTNTYSTISGAPGSNAYRGGVLLPDGRVLFVPYSATAIGLFDPSTNTLNTSVLAGASDSCAGGVLLPDGRVLFVPHSATAIGLFDPSTNTLNTNIYVGLTTDKYISGVLLPDGRVVFVPFNLTTIGILSGFPRPPIELCYHPCFNKL